MMKSKTMWFAAALAMLGVVQASTDMLQTLVTPQMYGWIMLAVAAIVAGLRVVTTQPLDEK